MIESKVKTVCAGCLGNIDQGEEMNMKRYVERGNFCLNCDKKVNDSMKRKAARSEAFKRKYYSGDKPYLT